MAGSLLVHEIGIEFEWNFEIIWDVGNTFVDKFVSKHALTVSLEL